MYLKQSFKDISIEPESFKITTKLKMEDINSSEKIVILEQVKETAP